MALKINYYLFICRRICLSSVSSHWTLTSGERVRRGGGRRSLSLKPQNVSEDLLLDKRDSKSEKKSVTTTGVSVKKTQRLELSVYGGPFSPGIGWCVPAQVKCPHGGLGKAEGNMNLHVFRDGA